MKKGRKILVCALALTTAFSVFIVASAKLENDSPTTVSAVGETTSKTVLSRESWETSFEVGGKIHPVICTAYVYDDGTVRVTYQNTDRSVYDRNYDVTLGTMWFNDALYQHPVYIDEHNHEYDSCSEITLCLKSSKSYDATRVGITLSYHFVSGSTIPVKETIIFELRPRNPFVEKTELDILGHTIVVNESGTEKNQTDLMFGDIDGDGIINSKDAAMNLRYSAYLGTAPEPMSFLEWKKANT